MTLTFRIVEITMETAFDGGPAIGRSSVRASWSPSKRLALLALLAIPCKSTPGQPRHPARPAPRPPNGGVIPRTPLTLLVFASTWSILPTAGDSVSSCVKRGQGSCRHLSPLLQSPKERGSGRALGKMRNGPGIKRHDYLQPTGPYSSTKPSWLVLLPWRVASSGPKPSTVGNIHVTLV